MYSWGAIIMLLSIVVLKIRDKISTIHLIIAFEILEVSAAVIMGVSTLFESNLSFCLLSGMSRFF